MQDDSLPLKVMHVLQQWTDENHPLTQARLAHLIERQYGTEVAPRLLRRVLAALANFDDSIEYIEHPRGGREADNGSSTRTNFFFRHPFSDSELRLLADSVAFLPCLPSAQRRDLLDKIRALGSRYFEIRPLLSTPSRQDENKQLFLNIELLDEAIRLGRKLSASYLSFDAAKKLSPRCRPDGSVRHYRLSPYRMLMNDGRYYLICNNEKYDDLAHYRIDRLQDVRILPEPVRPLQELDPDSQTDTDRYIREHVYMYSGRSVQAHLRLRPACITDAVDLFGPAIDFRQERDGWVQAIVRAHPLAVCRFARNFGNAVVLESPQYLRDQIRADLSAALSEYEEDTATSRRFHTAAPADSAAAPPKACAEDGFTSC